MGRRKVKEDIESLLTSATEVDICSRLLENYPIKKIIAALYGMICVSDTHISRPAISLMGFMVDRLFAEDEEAARIVVRRLIWNLNDESGGIGWGSPEAMGEIMARNTPLAEEFAHILVSYIREDGAYLDYEPLQQDVLRALGRLAECRPELLRSLNTSLYLKPLRQSGNAEIRTLAADALNLLDSP